MTSGFTCWERKPMDTKRSTTACEELGLRLGLRIGLGLGFGLGLGLGLGSGLGLDLGMRRWARVDKLVATDA